VGHAVPEETLRAFLPPDRALLSAERRFCRTTSCEVLYYGGDDRTVEKGAVAIRVGAKETEDPLPLCYCFGFTRADVRRELAETGASAIPARISAEIRAGRCACAVKNPAGICCLGEVRAAVKAEGAGAAREEEDLLFDTG
jgi:hypothetical protein